MLRHARIVLWSASAAVATVFVVASVAITVNRSHRGASEVPAPLAAGTELLRPRSIPPVRPIGR